MPRKKAKSARPRRRPAVSRGPRAAAAVAATAGAFDTLAYWLMPSGLKGLLTTVFWSGSAWARVRTRKGRSAPPQTRPAERLDQLDDHDANNDEREEFRHAAFDQ